MMLRLSLLFMLLLTVTVGCRRETETGVSASGPTAAAPATPASRDLTVLVGAGRGTSAINAYFPATVRIRAGDSVTWKMNSEADQHTVTFTDDPTRLIDHIIPAGGSPTDSIVNPSLLIPTRQAGEPRETYSGGEDINSGIFFPRALAQALGPDVLSVDSFSLIFDTPGSYDYVCGFHEFHKGTVVVEPATATDVPSQEDIDAQARKEIAPLLQLTDSIQALLASRRVIDSEIGPNDNTIWFVSAGMGRPEAEVLEFLPKQLVISEGDTVVWAASRFHSVVFNPGRRPPAFYLPSAQPDGTPLVALNPDVFLPSKPSAEFDGTGFYSSGLIAYGVHPGGVGFSLTFTKAGSYSYSCPIHLDVGMVGAIIVVAR